MTEAASINPNEKGAFNTPVQVSGVSVCSPMPCSLCLYAHNHWGGAGTDCR